MKIAHVFWGLTYGGIETMLVNIVNEQALLGEDVSIIIINDIVVPELYKRITPQVKVIRINRQIGSRGLGFIRHINKQLDLLNPDVIHLHRSEIINFLSTKRIRMSCCVATLHAMPSGRVGMAWRWGSFMQWLLFPHQGNVLGLRRFSRVFSISNTVAQSLEVNYGIESVVVPNGIAVKNFLSRDDRQKGKLFRIVQVSRLVHEKKGQDLLIDAVSILKECGIDNWNLTFIGEGDSLEYLQSLVISKNLDGFVHFLGSKDQTYIAEHLKDFDVFVQPSRFEGFGLTVAEAMAAHLPVIVSSGQGPSEVTEGNRYGWVFENGNAQELADVLRYVKEHKEESLAKAKEGIAMVKERYDVSVTAKKYIAEYKKLI